ncbi:MAG: hypothetical protein U1B78_04985 [Dehalococcoidia bacterium]|nr:hypothetical protein [Dehalococcoidia bacterium]
MGLLQRGSEELARRTTRRSFFGRGADLVFGTLIGAAAGAATRPLGASAGSNTECAFPGPPCSCDKCMRPDGVTTNGTCAKPCVMNTNWYASGCWVSPSGYTCCDCECPDVSGSGWCGCGSDYHNNPSLCPEAAV